MHLHGKLLIVLAALLWAGYGTAAILRSTNDLWDISRGAVVTATSGTHVPYSDIRDMFGGTFSPVEPGTAIFSDSQPAGFVHYVEWQTPAPVTVGSFNLFAFGDLSQNNQREFAKFVLKAKSSPSATNFDLTLYTLVVTNHPYVFVDQANVCLVSAGITPVTAQYFRAEFTQYTGGFGFDGPRIVELDGYGPAAPVLAGPTNETVTAGQNASFSVSATGTPPLSYQWYENSTNIPAAGNPTATNATLVLTGVQTNQSGNTYHVVVSNTYGTTNSSSATLTVIPDVCTPPPSGLVDWWQGEGNTLDSIGALNGTNVNGVTFVPGEVGTAFSFNGTNQYITQAVQRLTNIVDSYTIEFWAWPTAARADTPEDNNDITGIANQRYAVVPSLDVNDSIAGAGVSVGTNGVSVFEHAPNFLPSPLVYDTPITGWTHIAVVYVNRQPSLYLNGVLVHTGVTSSRSSHPSTSLGENHYNYGYYSGLLDEVSIYNRSLSGAEIQAIYNAGADGKCFSPPVIAGQPQSETLYAGNAASFTVNAGGAQSLSYQWSENMTNIPAALNPTATNATLVLANVSVGQSGNIYSVTVGNSAGSTNSTNAVLTVLGPGSCFSPPAGLVSWWPGEKSGIDIFGTNNATLTGVTFAPGEVGEAFVFNGTSSAIHIPASASLNVGTSSGFTIEGWIKPTSLTVNEPLAVWNNGTDNLGVHLQLNQPPVWGGNGPGSIFSTISDTSSDAPHNIASPANVLSTNNWNHVALTYDQASGMAAMYVNGVAVTVENLGVFTPQTSYDFYLGFSPQDPSFALYYYTGLMDEMSLYNRALSAIEIQNIYDAGSAGKCSEPEISMQPVSQVGYAGGSTTLSVSVAGSGPFTYQWNYNGAPIGNATNATLMLGDLQTGSAGAYTVTVSDPYGSVTSAAANLSVNVAGVSIALYAGIDITGVPGLTYGVQYSTNLGDTNGWLGLTNLTLSQTNELYFDLEPAQQQHRYYRVVPGPISIP